MEEQDRDASSSADANSASDVAVPNGAMATAGAAMGGPSFGARAGGTNFAKTRSGLAGLPSRPPPSPHFSGPLEPSFASKPIGRVSPAWWKFRSLWVLAVLIVLLFLAAAALFSSSSSTEREEPTFRADPGEPAPASYQMIESRGYHFAVPEGWTAETLDAQVMEGSGRAASAGRRELTVTTDPVTRDSVNVVPYVSRNGDSLEKSVLTEFENDFRDGVAGTQIVELRVDRVKVHGYPAGKLTASVVGPDGPATVISTVIETEDGLFQVTVTSGAPDRARILDTLVLPTFDPR